MTLLGPIFAAGGAERTEVPLTSSTLLELFGGHSTASGVSVTPEKAVGLPAVWRAVNLIAGTIASLPLHAYRNVEGARIRATTGRAAVLLEEPSPGMTPMEFWEVVYAHLLLWGNAYIWKRRNSLGVFTEWFILHPSRVKVGRARITDPKVFQVDSKVDFVDDDACPIMHIPGFGYDGVCGVSPIRAARQGLGLALAAEEYGAKLFGSGSLATGVLQTEQRLTASQADVIQKRWSEKRAGMNSAHSTIVLDRGTQFQQLSIPPEDAQFIESRRFQVSEVARLFGAPPHMLMDITGSTSWGTGIEQQGIGFVVYTLRPWMTRVEQRVTREIRPQALYARYSVEGLLRGDSAARGAFYKTLWGLGVLSTNDIRALEEMAPVEGGDTRYRPLNFGELGASDATPTQEAPL